MTLCKATTCDATVLCETRNTTIEHSNTPEWDAMSEQAATNTAERATNATYRWAEALP